MVEYFSAAFFAEVASRLNADAEWRKKAASLAVKVVLTCVDRGRSFLIEAHDGIVSSTETSPDVPADFKFEGTYDAWSLLGKGEKDLQSLVLGGKIRFRGSMPKIMALMGPLTRLTQVAQQVPKEF
jgi:putative sterol carrier protein